jgi:hypothetical protein
MWPSCPQHGGKLRRFCTVRGVLWHYCTGAGWHAPRGLA